MQTQAVLFDLDGVIINSGADIAASVNATLIHFGYTEVPEDVLIGYVGNGAKSLLSRSLAYQHVSVSDMPDFQEFFEWYVSWYRSHAVCKTVLYDGVYELLERLKAKNIYAAVVSNKPLSVTEEVLKHFKIDVFFDAVVGPEQLQHIKPDPEGLVLAVNLIEKKYGTKIPRNNIIMVGDSATDIQAGRNFGCRTCAVTDGLGNREALLAEKADIVVPLAGCLKID
ncbi:HAD-IA family hydrolase [Treponema sp. OMZ 840]|uniref:HAD family hydrolase n=1 Tax=Treponema sp. OMZ 840 TaxID=244313 RepID=UPI003D8C71C8